MRRTLLSTALVLIGGGCVVHADADDECGYDEGYECYVEYTPGYGYSRVCELAIEPVICIDFDDDDSPPSRYRRSSSSGTASASGGASGDASGNASGSASGDASGNVSGNDSGNVSTEAEADASEFPCTRDAQCGTGLCIEGECFYGCEGDADCGTADRCLALDEVPVCQADEDAAIECTRSAECGYEQVCLNASCHDSCALTSDCNNELDRCVAGICVPDRRVVSECLLDRECPDNEVCIDATCQAR